MAATNASDYWTGARDQLTSLFFDTARDRLIDVESANDDRSLRDRIDAREGTLTVPGTGVSWVTVGVIAALAFAAVIIAKKVL